MSQHKIDQRELLNKALASLPSTRSYLISFNGLPKISLADKRAQQFMERVATGFTDRKKCFIIVNHIVPNVMPFINALDKSGRIAGVIAKPNSIDRITHKILQNRHIPFLDITKQDLCSPDIIPAKIAPLLRDNEGLIISDIGGYFSHSLKSLQNLKNIVGIVEDTENGLQKYERALATSPDNKIPIYSIARSRVKGFEDYLVGRSIADSTLRVLRENGIDYRNKTVGIIGFGEVGRGAALYLRDYKNCNVRVFDKDELVQSLAKQSGFNAVSRDEVLNSSNIIICATGNNSLKDGDLKYLKKGCYISSCTSGDDEFDFVSTKIANHASAGVRMRDVNGLFFLNDGNAINFVDSKQHANMLAPYIHLTNSGNITCCVNLDNNRVQNALRVNVLTSGEEENLIAKFLGFMNPNNKNSKFINSLTLSNLAGK